MIRDDLIHAPGISDNADNHQGVYAESLAERPCETDSNEADLKRRKVRRKFVTRENGFATCLSALIREGVSEEMEGFEFSK